MSDDTKLTITVRGTEGDDWEDIAEMMQGDNVYANTLQLPYYSRDRIRERTENTPPHIFSLAAVVEETVVGLLGLHIESGRRAHVAGLGMMVHQDYQGQGVGSALMAAALELADGWLNILRVELDVFTNNVAGLALYRKFGFEIEGTMRHYAFRDGRYQDTYLMARLHPSFEALTSGADVDA